MISADGEVRFSISKIEHSDVEQELGLMGLMMVDSVVTMEAMMCGLGAHIGHRGHLGLETLKQDEIS